MAYHNAFSKLLLSFVAFSLFGDLIIESSLGQTQVQYQQAPVRIGAGGYVTGLAIHPSQPNVKYCRTDVGGAYRWNQQQGRWIQILTSNRFPNVDPPEEAGVESIAVATSNFRKVYMATLGAIYRSSNSGVTFSKISPEFDLQPNADNEWRVHGERLVVDPLDENRVVFGSRNEGLWKTDNGTDWVKSELPNGLTDVGVTCVVFGPPESLRAGDEFTELFAAVSHAGIFKSVDGGNNWALISGETGQPENDVIEVTDMEIANDGTLVVTINGEGEFGDSEIGGSVWKYRTGAAWGENQSDWKSISPEDPWQGEYVSVALDPENSDRALVSEPGFKVAYYTIDGGQTWAELYDGWASGSPIRFSPEIPWHETSGNDWFEHGEIQFDPNHPDRIICAHGMGVWYADNVDAQVRDEGRLGWTTQSLGIEELVSKDIISAPGKAPIFGAMDFTSFRATQLGRYNSKRSRDGRLSDTWDLSYQENDPNFMVMSAYKFGENQSSFSTDGGVSWQEFPSLNNGSHPGNLNWGVIAVSTTSEEVDRTIVWSPSDNTLPYYSEDDGNSWLPVESWPNGSDGEPIETGIWFQFFRAQTLIADPNVAGRFYMYLKAEDGVLVRSDDGGRNWELVSDQLPMWGHNGVLRAVPNREGHLWFTPGLAAEEKGVWHSTDGGVTFEKLEEFSAATSVSIGKHGPLSRVPTVFVLGEYEGQEGVFLTDDYGDEWKQAVQGRPLGLLDTPITLEADRNQYGRFFIGFQGTGFSWGRPRRKLPPFFLSLVRPYVDEFQQVMPRK